MGDQPFDIAAVATDPRTPSINRCEAHVPHRAHASREDAIAHWVGEFARVERAATPALAERAARYFANDGDDSAATPNPPLLDYAKEELAATRLHPPMQRSCRFRIPAAELTCCRMSAQNKKKVKMETHPSTSDTNVALSPTIASLPALCCDPHFRPLAREPR